MRVFSASFAPGVLLGFVLALASAALFAIRPIFVKLTYAEGIDPNTLIVLRMAISAPIYAVLLYWFLRSRANFEIRPRTLSIIIVAGTFGYFLASLLDLIGLQYVTTQLGRMILYVYPSFVVLIGALVFGQAITLRLIGALILTYLGIAFIFGHDLQMFGPDTITGTLWILASALAFSVYLVLSKPLVQEVGSRVFTCIALLAASAAVGVYFFTIAGGVQAMPPVNQNAWGYITFIAIFCTVIPTFFTTAAVARIGPERTGIIAMIGPGFTSVFAVLILAEQFTIYHLLGIIITVIGVAMLPRN